MYEDIILKEKYGKPPTEKEFKVLFCSICELYKNCHFNAIKECIKEFNEKT